MRSVRCDACGTKALMAASQCPKCGHLFEVRDGSGEQLPVAHCPSCDSYYPAHVHSCKWCGTTLIPEKPRKGDSSHLRWIAAGTFAVAIVLGLLARDPSPKLTSHPRASAQAKPKAAAPMDTLARTASPALVDTAVPRDTAAGADAVLTEASTPPATDVSTPAASIPPSADPVVIPQSASAPSAVAAAPAAPSVRATTTISRRERRPSASWVGMVAKQWVTVRADAQRSAHIVASVGPNSRVQLGETRGSWRRIKSRGIAGWVEVSSGSFVPIRSPSHRTRRMADR